MLVQILVSIASSPRYYNMPKGCKKDRLVKLLKQWCRKVNIFFHVDATRRLGNSRLGQNDSARVRVVVVVESSIVPVIPVA